METFQYFKPYFSSICFHESSTVLEHVRYDSEFVSRSRLEEKKKNKVFRQQSSMAFWMIFISNSQTCWQFWFGRRWDS